MIDFKRKDRYGFDDLVQIIHLLRAPGGCPWDREQTHRSIRRNFLEETYEVLEAIDQDDPVHMCEELGDVLTQVVFHGDMEQDSGRPSPRVLFSANKGLCTHTPFKTYPVCLVLWPIKVWSCRRELNPRPVDYKTTALPSELRQQKAPGRFGACP